MSIHVRSWRLFFGEMAFLDGAARSADATAFTDADLYVLSRQTFDKLAEVHKKVALKLLEGLARVLAGRLRYADTEIRALECVAFCFAHDINQLFVSRVVVAHGHLDGFPPHDFRQRLRRHMRCKS